VRAKDDGLGARSGAWRPQRGKFIGEETEPTVVWVACENFDISKRRDVCRKIYIFNDDDLSEPGNRRKMREEEFLKGCVLRAASSASKGLSDLIGSR
jgi:hypothetical protein